MKRAVPLTIELTGIERKKHWKRKSMKYSLFLKVQEPLTSEGEKLPSYEKNFRVKTANGKQLPQANEQLRDEEQLYDEEQIPAKEQLLQANEQLCDEQIPAKEQLPQANEQLPDEEQLPAKEQLEDSTAVAFNDVKVFIHSKDSLNVSDFIHSLISVLSKVKSFM